MSLSSEKLRAMPYPRVASSGKDYDVEFKRKNILVC